MTQVNADIQMTGVETSLKVVDNLQKEVGKKAIHQAVAKAGQYIASLQRQYVPVRYGAMKLSIGVRQKVYNFGEVDFIAIGPRRKLVYDTPGGRAAPSKYAHLLEFGHGIVPRGPGIGRGGGSSKSRSSGGKRQAIGKVAAYPFIKPSIENSKATVAGIMQTAFNAAVAKHSAPAE